MLLRVIIVKNKNKEKNLQKREITKLNFNPNWIKKTESYRQLLTTLYSAAAIDPQHLYMNRSSAN
jgi:hypothetical protein